jgi:ankyrin repeat protein
MGRMSDAPGPELVELAHQMFDLARTGEAERLAAYVDAGVPADLTDASGNTLLMLAAYHGHATTVALLAERGADPDRVNDRGQSPLAGAVFKDEQEVVQALLSAGADPDAGTPSARETAALFGRPDLFEESQRSG